MVFGTFAVVGASYVLTRIFGGGETVVFRKQYNHTETELWRTRFTELLDRWRSHSAVSDEDVVEIRSWVVLANMNLHESALEFSFLGEDQPVREARAKKLRELQSHGEIPLAHIISWSRSEDDLRQGLAWILTAHLDGGRPWRIVDQNHLAPSEDMYTGCWFDYLVTAIINYYPKIMGRICALLDEHGYTSSYKKPKELIQKLRKCVFMDAYERYDSEPKIREAVRAAVTYYDMAANPDEDVRRITNMHVAQAQKGRSREYPVDRYSEMLEASEGVIGELHFDEEIYKDRFTFDVLCYVQSSCSADASVLNELMAYVLNIGIVHVEAYLPPAVNRMFHDFLTYEPDGGLDALSPYLYVVKYINMPKTTHEIAEAADFTIWSFATSTPGGGHAMFMVDREPQPWDPTGAPCDPNAHLHTGLTPRSHKRQRTDSEKWRIEELS